MSYSSHPQHRNVAFAGNKSQWTISGHDEIKCYLNSHESYWFCGDNYWGLHLVANAPFQLGVSRLPEKYPLHIAKFVDDPQRKDNWHGYPVAHWLSPFDKPDEKILNKWLDAGFITKSTFAKIHRGKQCKL